MRTPEPRVLNERSTITAKGQTTVPKSVRQALGVDYGGRIAFRMEGGRVIVENAEREQPDPAVRAFLSFLERDIATDGHVRDLPQSLMRSLRRLAKKAEVELDETLEGDVAI